MGKLSEGQAKDLLDKGVIDKSTYKKMEDDGIISAGRGVKRRYIQTLMVTMYHLCCTSQD